MVGRLPENEEVTLPFFADGITFMRVMIGRLSHYQPGQLLNGEFQNYS